MAQNDVAVRDVEWSRVVSVKHLLRAFRIALWPPSKLVLCLAALAIILAAGILLDRAYQTQVCSQSFEANLYDVFQAAMGWRIDLHEVRARPVVGRQPIVPAARPVTVEVLRDAPQESAEPEWINLIQLRGFYYGPLESLRHVGRLVVRYWTEAPWFALSLAAISFLTWTFFGGAVCRLAALQFAKDERATLSQAVTFACQRYGSLLMSRLALFIVLALLALPAALAASGILMIPWGVGEVVTGLLFFLLLLVGVLLTFLALFGVASQGLVMPAIGAEGRDSFDAVSRAVNYVFARPWKYLFYTLFSLLYLSFSFVVVRLFTFLVLKIPYVFLKLWPWVGKSSADASGEAGPGKLARIWIEPTMFQLFRMPENVAGSEYFAAVCIGVFVVILVGLMVSFIPSFLLTSQTIIYFLLRRHVDFKDLEKTDETLLEPEPPVAGEKPAESE
jgi:hypothetical protein